MGCSHGDTGEPVAFQGAPHLQGAYSSDTRNLQADYQPHGEKTVHVLSRAVRCLQRVTSQAT